VSEFPVTSQSGKDMLGELPSFYETVHETRIIMQMEGQQFDQLQADIEDQLNQRFISTATWDLPNWEEEFGIMLPAGQPIEQRRSVVRSKMRGIGKFSGRLLKSVAEAYDNGTVDVSFNPALGQFTVKFVSTRGTPPNLDDLKSAVADIIPSHLVVAYSFRYLMISEVEAMTIDQIEATMLDQFAWG
jgi:hypothetical protein